MLSDSPVSQEAKSQSKNHRERETHTHTHSLSLSLSPRLPRAPLPGKSALGLRRLPREESRHPPPARPVAWARPPRDNPLNTNPFPPPPPQVEEGAAESPLPVVRGKREGTRHAPDGSHPPRHTRRGRLNHYFKPSGGKVANPEGGQRQIQTIQNLIIKFTGFCRP